MMFGLDCSRGAATDRSQGWSEQRAQPLGCGTYGSESPGGAQVLSPLRGSGHFRWPAFQGFRCSTPGYDRSPLRGCKETG